MSDSVGECKTRPGSRQVYNRRESNAFGFFDHTGSTSGGAGTHDGALGLPGGELVAVCEAPCDRAGRSGGGVGGPAGGKGGAILGHRQRMARQAPEERIWTQGSHEGALIACAAPSDGWPMQSRAQAGASRVDRFGPVWEPEQLPQGSPGGVSAAIVLGIRPGTANKGGTCCGGLGRHGSSLRVWYRGATGHADGRSAKA